jgi:hypothetical protein
VTTCDARGWHEGRWAYTNAEHDGAMYRCVCGGQRWLQYLTGTRPPETLRWSSL